MIAGLERLAPDPTVRCLALRGAGKHFQAGADAVTTGTAFGPLALSRHPGTASMGALADQPRLRADGEPSVRLVDGGCLGRAVQIPAGRVFKRGRGRLFDSGWKVIAC